MEARLCKHEEASITLKRASSSLPALTSGFQTFTALYGSYIRLITCSANNQLRPHPHPSNARERSQRAASLATAVSLPHACHGS